MRRRILIFSVFIATLLWSCSNGRVNGDGSEGDVVVPQTDGSYHLSVAKADCYSDSDSPSSNTAEWDIMVSEAGRYKVWIASATLDTLNLRYSNPVKVNLLDNRLDVNPECDRVVADSKEVTLPYYRADSYMGLFYFPEPGRYTLQVISENIFPAEANNLSVSSSDDTRLLSVILTPVTR